MAVLVDTTGVVTLAQVAGMQQDFLQRGVLDIFAGDVKLRDLLQFVDTKGDFHYKFYRPDPDNQAAVGYGNLNEEFNTVSSELEQVEERVQPMGNYIRIDKRISGQSSLAEKPGPVQMRSLIGQLALEFNDAVINGDAKTKFGTSGSGGAIYRPDGIRQRLTRADTYKMDSSLIWDAGGLDLTVQNIDTASARTLARYVDELIDALDPDVLFVNKYLKPILRSVWSEAQLLSVDKDQFGRKIESYGDVRIIDTGMKTATRKQRNAADTTNVVQAWEDATGALAPTAAAGARFTSIFAAKLGTEAFHAIQPYAMQTVGPTLLPNQLHEQWMINWGYGFVTKSTGCLGWIKDILIQ